MEDKNLPSKLLAARIQSIQVKNTNITMNTRIKNGKQKTFWLKIKRIFNTVLGKINF